MPKGKRYSHLHIIIRITQPNGSRSEWSLDLDHRLAHLSLYDRYNQPYQVKEVSLDRFFEEFFKTASSVAPASGDRVL